MINKDLGYKWFEKDIEVTVEFNKLKTEFIREKYIGSINKFVEKKI